MILLVLVLSKTGSMLLRSRRKPLQCHSRGSFTPSNSMISRQKTGMPKFAIFRPVIVFGSWNLAIPCGTLDPSLTCLHSSWLLSVTAIALAHSSHSYMIFQNDREALGHFDALLAATTGLDCTDFADKDKKPDTSETALESAAARVPLCLCEKS